MNQTIISGNLTRDPETRYVGDTTVTKFSIGHNKTFTSNGQHKKKTTFIDIEVWGKLGENCQSFIRSGTKVCVRGELEEDRWEKEGIKRSRHKITAQQVDFLSAPKQQAAPQQAPAGGGEQAGKMPAPPERFGESMNQDVPY